MSKICAHCKKAFTCNCQKFRSQDGQIIHKTCKNAYEQKPSSVNRDVLTQQINNAQNNIIRR